MHAEASPPCLTGWLRNRSALLLTDLSNEVSFYDDKGKVGKATIGGFADRLQGKTSGEKGVSDMRVLPGEGRELAVQMEVRVPTHYTRVEYRVFDAWGAPPDSPAGMSRQGPAWP